MAQYASVDNQALHVTVGKVITLNAGGFKINMSSDFPIYHDILQELSRLIQHTPPLELLDSLKNIKTPE